MPGPKAKLHASELTKQQRIGRAQMKLVLNGKDQFGIPYSKEARRLLLKEAAKNLRSKAPITPVETNVKKKKLPPKPRRFMGGDQGFDRIIRLRNKRMGKPDAK